MMLRRLRTRTGMVMAATLVALAAIWLAVLQLLHEHKHSMLEQAALSQQRQTQTAAAALDRHTRLIPLLATSPDSSQAVTDVFRSVAVYDPALRPLRVLNGSATLPNSEPLEDIRELLRNRPATGQLKAHVGGATHRLGQMKLAMPMILGGEPVVVAAELRLAPLLNEVFRPGADTGFLLISGEDGTELTRMGQGPQAGRPPPRHNGANAQAAAAANDGYVSTTALAESLGATISVHRREKDILAAYGHVRDRSILLLLVLSAAVLTLTSFVLRRIQRGEASVQSAQRQARELIEQLEEEKRRAIALSAHDALTGLANRRLFSELATSHIAAARRSQRHCAVLYLDLDLFKEVNDRCGHHVGDMLLKQVAQRLQAQLRDSDVVARLSGDEFAVLLTGMENEKQITSIAARIVASLSEPYPDLDGHDVSTSPSLGIAVFPRHARDLTTLCRLADSAMYQAKRSGRGRHVMYDPATAMDEQRRSTLAGDLPGALASGGLALRYEPRVDLYNYRLLGLEVLPSWDHPRYGTVIATEIYAVAEPLGLGGEIDTWMIAACCAQLADWRRSDLAAVPLSLPAREEQLARPGFAAELCARATAAEVPTWLLEIEITEDLLHASDTAARENLQNLRQAGVRISLDKFGTGFSGLGYLQNLAIDRIKIAPELISGLRNSVYDAVTVTSIISVAQRLGMTVVAEGVDLVEQLVHLKTARCNQAQGVLFGRPVSAAATAALLRHPVLLPD